MGIHAEDGPHDFRASCPHKAGNPQDFPFSEVEGNIMEYTGLGESFHPENFIPRHIGAGRIIFAHHTAYHVPYDLVHVRFFRGAGADGLAIPHDSDGIAVGKNFFHAVGNIDNGNAPAFQLSHYFKKPVGFPFRQRCGRFVHNDSLRIQHKAPGDFRHLLLAYRAFPGDFIKGQLNADFLAFVFRHLMHLLKSMVPNLVFGWFIRKRFSSTDRFGQMFSS